MSGRALQVHNADEMPSLARVNDGDYASLLSLATELVSSGFLPRHISKPGQAVAIILTGRELGMQPMRALRALRMVEGNVTEDAGSQLARFKTDGGSATWIELTDKRAELHLVMRNGDETTSTFTIEDAQRAKLTGKDVWQKYPKAMLRSRAITQGLKDLGWEGGVAVYDPEELSVARLDSADAEAQAVRPVTAGAPPRPAHVTSDGEDLSAMTLEDALAVRLRGASDKWGGNGSKPLADVPPSVIAAAHKFFKDKNDAQPDDALAHQVRALSLVHAWRREEAERDQEKLDLDGAQAGARAPHDPPAESSSPSSGPAPEVPTMPELMKLSPAVLKAKVLELLDHPALAALRSEKLTLVAAGMSKSQYASIVIDLTTMIVGATPVPGALNEKGERGILPGEFDQ